MKRPGCNVICIYYNESILWMMSSCTYLYLSIHIQYWVNSRIAFVEAWALSYFILTSPDLFGFVCLFLARTLFCCIAELIVRLLIFDFWFLFSICFHAVSWVVYDFFCSFLWSICLSVLRSVLLIHIILGSIRFTSLL